MSDWSRPPDDTSESMVLRTIMVMIVLPTVAAAVVGAVIGYSINGVAGSIAAGLFLGLSGSFVGTFVYWLVGPVNVKPLPVILLTLVFMAALAFLILY